MASPAPAVDSPPLLPDLEISIRLEGSSLHFAVHAPDPASGINNLPLHPVHFGLAPDKYLYHLFKDIDHLSLATEDDREVAEHKLEAKGLAIWELFPGELRELLWKRRGQALSLLIQSDEPFVPWEIAKLQGRGKNGKSLTGKFLCEAFAVTRWIRGLPHRTRLSLANLALVVPQTSKLPSAAVEREEIRALAERNRRTATAVDPSYLSIRRAFKSGFYDGWHFAGHGIAAGDDANRWGLDLDAPPPFTPEDLGAAAQLQETKPVVFLNGCSTGRGGLTLTGAGGWSAAFLKAGAGAFIGTHWAITDDKALEMAKAVYSGLFAGQPIGEAFRTARLRLHKKHKGDPTWLAYTVFSHPLASSASSHEGTRAPLRKRDPASDRFAAPSQTWRPAIDPPAALLQAKFGIVPFHRREKELSDLLDWCRDPLPARVRLYTGKGGMGKTRLALEAAIQMRKEGWRSGFLTAEALRKPEGTWKSLVRPEGKLLLVVDYAESHRQFLVPVLRKLYASGHGPVRLLLLARAALDWWEQLKSEREGVGELLSGPATSRIPLLPLADSLEGRAESYDLAARAFAERLARARPAGPPPNLEASHFERVLFLHMSALLEVDGTDRVKEEDRILDRILDRERSFWATRTADFGISPEIVPGIGRALAAITLGGGVVGEEEALEVLRRLKIFQDQPAAVLTAVALLLHECYPGERWIEPIQPDLLAEHLVQRELENEADELFDLVLGPRSRE